MKKWILLLLPIVMISCENSEENFDEEYYSGLYHCEAKITKPLPYPECALTHYEPVSTTRTIETHIEVLIADQNIIIQPDTGNQLTENLFDDPYDYQLTGFNVYTSSTFEMNIFGDGTTEYERVIIDGTFYDDNFDFKYTSYKDSSTNTGVRRSMWITDEFYCYKP